MSGPARPRWPRLLPGLAGLAFGLGLLVETLRLDVELQQNVGGVIGPDAYPGLLAGLILLLAAVLLWQAVGAVPAVEPAPSADTGAEERPPAYGRVMLTLALLVAFTLLLEPIGFVIVTPITLFALMAITGDRRWWLTITSALAITLALYLFFRYGMNLVLPEGLLGERGF